jgi:hypothetical protein
MGLLANPPRRRSRPGRETQEVETRETTRNETVRGIAKKIADEACGGVDLASQIIESYNLYDQSKITDVQVEEL